MKKMVRINIHIERLVLDGLPVDRSDGPAVKEAVEEELTRLLAEGGIGEELTTSGTVASVASARMEFDETSCPESIAKSIAGAVYGGLNP
jgi:hypothetical protein